MISFSSSTTATLRVHRHARIRVLLCGTVFAGAVLASFLLPASMAHSQQQQQGTSSSRPGGAVSSSQGTSSSAGTPKRGVEAAGSAITLETSEALFQVAAGLNACGYDADLEHSLPVRQQIRDEINQTLQSSAPARDSRDALCAYMVAHQATGSRNLAQYVSLALYLTPPPELTPSADETEMPPDANQVVNVLPLLRTFAEQTNLHFIWINHRAEYEAAVAQVHDPLTRTMLDTNIYLKQPVSSYDGRRFTVLLEPMLAPSDVNARIYGSDYFVVTSPSPIAPDVAVTKQSTGGIHLNDIRHVYLHYEVEPLVYARASATDRLQPLLKTVQDAPLEFNYKNDIVALVTECLIKGIEARTMDVGFPKPKKPENVRQRSQIDQYNQEIIDYEHKSEVVRRKQVDTDMRQGWVLTEYLYEKLAQMDRESVSLKEDIGQMVYGMDVYHEQNRAKNIQFFPESSSEVLSRGRPAHRVLTSLDQAELKLIKGDTNGAEAIAKKELATTPNSGEATYILARIDLMRGDPEQAVERFHKVLTLTKDPRTLA